MKIAIARWALVSIVALLCFFTVTVVHAQATITINGHTFHGANIEYTQRGDSPPVVRVGPNNVIPPRRRPGPPPRVHHRPHDEEVRGIPWDAYERGRYRRDCVVYDSWKRVYLPC